MNDYELVVLYHPDLEIDLDKPLKKIEKIITDNGGKITKQDNWGKRKLAYTIKKEDHAVYVYYEVQLPTENVRRVEGTFNITDEVLRYLLVKPDPRVEAVVPSAADDEESADEAQEEE